MSPLTALQHKRLSKAIARRSGQQVTLPEVSIRAEQAKAIWRDVTLAFGPATGRRLTSPEVALLKRRAAELSLGYVALEEDTVALEAGLVLWRLAGQLGVLAPDRPRHARLAGVAVLGLAATQLAACGLVFGGHVKGSFACSAPAGTCAPSTRIDDEALSVIQNARPMVPAGPYRSEPQKPVRVALADTAARVGMPETANDGMVHRSRRILRVVFPSYVDGEGNLHEPRIVHTVADEGAWMAVSSGAPNAGEQVEGAALASAASAYAAPAQAAPAGLVGQAMGPSLQSDASTAVPDPALVAAARAHSPGAANAIEAIRAEVEARLAATPKAPTASPPANAAASAKPAATNQPAPFSGPGAE